MTKRIVLFTLVILALAACNRGKIEVERKAGGGATVTVTVSESEINDVITEALAVENPLLRDPHVDLQAGKIVVTGEHDQRDGSGRVSGNFTMTLSVQDGALLAQITDVQIQGIDLSDERIANINARMAQRLTERAGRENRIITVTSVTITDNDVEIVFETDPR